LRFILKISAVRYRLKIPWWFLNFLIFGILKNFSFWRGTSGFPAEKFTKARPRFGWTKIPTGDGSTGNPAPFFTIFLIASFRVKEAGKERIWKERKRR
jgi:hypothetical protein